LSVPLLIKTKISLQNKFILFIILESNKNV